MSTQANIFIIVNDKFLRNSRVKARRGNSIGSLFFCISHKFYSKGLVTRLCHTAK